MIVGVPPVPQWETASPQQNPWLFVVVGYSSQQVIVGVPPVVSPSDSSDNARSDNGHGTLLVARPSSRVRHLLYTMRSSLQRHHNRTHSFALGSPDPAFRTNTSLLMSIPGLLTPFHHVASGINS